MLLKMHNQIIIDALVTDDKSILMVLQRLGYNRDQLIDRLRQSISTAITRHYTNRQKLSELHVIETDREEYRKLDQLEELILEMLRNQYRSLDSLVKPRSLQQFLRDYSR